MRTEQTDESIISEHEALMRDPNGILTHLRNDRLFGMEQIEQLSLGYVQIGEEGWISFPVCDEKGAPLFKKLKRPPKHPDNQEAYRTVPKGQPATLFPLQYLRYAAGDTIYLCEGEADTVTLRSHGCHAFSGTAGARTFKAEWCDYFIRHKIKKIVVLYDNDRWGKEGSEMVCKILHANMPELDIQKIVWPQGFKEAGDVTDFIVDGGKDSVTNLLKLVQPYEPMVDPEDDLYSTLEKGANQQRIFPVQAFHSGMAYFTVSVQEGQESKNYVISSKKEYFPCTHDELSRRGLIASRLPPEGMQGRWDQLQLSMFLQGADAFSLADLHNFISVKLREYVELSDKRHFDCLSLWVIATYYFRLFPAFPYLHITGEYQSGKTKVLQMLALLSFNGELLTSTSSPASIVRLVHSNGTTCCLDEVEHLWNAQDDHSRSLQDVLRNGYKRGASVLKCEPGKRKGHFEIVKYDPYSPKALGGIERLEQALASRCIQIVMLRSTNDALLNKEVEIESNEWSDIRALLYPAALCSYQEVHYTICTKDLEYASIHDSDPHVHDSCQKTQYNIRHILSFV